MMPVLWFALGLLVAAAAVGAAVLIPFLRLLYDTARVWRRG